MTELAVTKRCEDDLVELDPAVAEHILDLFEERRSLTPNHGEVMKRVANARKLHADMAGGRSIRAVTWYDRNRDVCWLVAAGLHEGFYERVEELHRPRELMPTPTDYANFEAERPARLLEAAVRSARKAMEAALTQPESEVQLLGAPFPETYIRVANGKLWVRCVAFHKASGC